MKLRNALIIFLLPVTLVFFSYAYAGDMEAEVIPAEVGQGDAFAVKISGAGSSELPVSVFRNRIIGFSECGKGCFIGIGAVDMDTKPGKYEIELDTMGKGTELALVVKKTDFPSISLTLPEGKVFPNKQDLKRAIREAEELKKIWPVSTEKLWSGKFILPLGNDISTVFGTKRVINKKKNSVHRGMDIRGKHGEKVKASNRGRVVLAEELFFGGNTVILDHGQKIYTIYMHLSAFGVKRGDVVSKGDIIGLVGSTGRVSGPHLHFGVKIMETNANPVSLIGLDL